MKSSVKELLDLYQIRRSYDQKTRFIQWLEIKTTELGWELKVDEHRKTRNLIVGDLEKAEIILTAHYDTPPNLYFPIISFFSNYIMFAISQVMQLLPILIILFLNRWFDRSGINPIISIIFRLIIMLFLFQVGFGIIANKNNANDNTSGVATLLSIMEDLPEDQRLKVCFVFFDNEEKGLVGSKKFKEKYTQTVYRKPLINFDCVANGSTLMFVCKEAFRNSEEFELLKESSEVMEKRSIFRNAVTHIYMSDQLRFRNSVGVVAAHKIPVLGYYLNRIHTRGDTIFQYENIIDLSTMMIRFIESI